MKQSNTEHTFIEHFKLTGIRVVPVLGVESLLGWANESYNGDFELILVVLSSCVFKSYHISQAKSEVVCRVIFFWEMDERKFTHSERI